MTDWDNTKFENLNLDRLHGLFKSLLEKTQDNEYYAPPEITLILPHDWFMRPTWVCYAMIVGGFERVKNMVWATKNLSGATHDPEQIIKEAIQIGLEDEDEVIRSYFEMLAANQVR